MSIRNLNEFLICKGSQYKSDLPLIVTNDIAEIIEVDVSLDKDSICFYDIKDQDINLIINKTYRFNLSNDTLDLCFYKENDKISVAKITDTETHKTYIDLEITNERFPEETPMLYYGIDNNNKINRGKINIIKSPIKKIIDDRNINNLYNDSPYIPINLEDMEVCDLIKNSVRYILSTVNKILKPEVVALLGNNNPDTITKTFLKKQLTNGLKQYLDSIKNELKREGEEYDPTEKENELDNINNASDYLIVKGECENILFTVSQQYLKNIEQQIDHKLESIPTDVNSNYSDEYNKLKEIKEIVSDARREFLIKNMLYSGYNVVLEDSHDYNSIIMATYLNLPKYENKHQYEEDYILTETDLPGIRLFGDKYIRGITIGSSDYLKFKNQSTQNKYYNITGLGDYYNSIEKNSAEKMETVYDKLDEMTNIRKLKYANEDDSEDRKIYYQLNCLNTILYSFLNLDSVEHKTIISGGKQNSVISKMLEMNPLNNKECIFETRITIQTLASVIKESCIYNTEYTEIFTNVNNNEFPLEIKNKNRFRNYNINGDNMINYIISLFNNF